MDFRCSTVLRGPEWICRREWWRVGCLVLLAATGCRAEQESGAALPPDSGGIPEWQIEAVATISSETDSLLLSVTDVAADADGNTYVLDQSGRQIRVYDSLGVPIRTIGRLGSGPAEFRRPYSLAWSGDTLAVLDPGNGRIELVRRDGRHVDSWRAARASGPAIRLHQAGQGRFFMVGFGQLGQMFLPAGPGAPVDTLAVPSEPNAPAMSVVCHPPSGDVTWHDIPFASRRIVTVSPEGNLLIARTSEYRLTWLDSTGAPNRIVAYGATPVPISDAEWDSLETVYREWRDKLTDATCEPDHLPRPDAKPALRAIEFDDTGRMWIESTTADGFRFDVWDGNSFIATVPAPERDTRKPFLVRGDRLYVVQSDETGEESVRIYRVRKDP